MRSLATTVLVAVLGLLAGCSSGSRGSELTGTLTIATGGTEGVYYQYGGAIADRLGESAPDLGVEVVATSGSVQNLAMIADGRATCAFTAGDAAVEATQGTGPFTRAVPLRAVARVYDDYLHLVATRSSGIRSLADLSGHRVSLGPDGSGTRLIVDRLLSVARLPDHRMPTSALGINESIAAMQQGRLDAFFWSGGAPTSGVSKLAEQTPVRIVAMASYASKMSVAFDGEYRLATLPPGTYGQPDGVMTLAVPNDIVCTPDVAPGIVDLLLTTLFSERDAMASAVPEVIALDRRAAINTSPVPLHTEARDWFRQTKP